MILDNLTRLTHLTKTLIISDSRMREGPHHDRQRAVRNATPSAAERRSGTGAGATAAGHGPGRGTPRRRRARREKRLFHRPLFVLLTPSRPARKEARMSL